MAKDITTVGTIESLKRLRSSHYGNPAFEVTLTDGRVLRTSADAGFSYGLENPEYRNVPIEFTLTKAGRIAYGKVVE